MKKFIPYLGIVFVIVLILVYPESAVFYASSSLSLCAKIIVPSLFPFFVLSSLLNRMGLPAALGKLIAPLGERLFGVSGAGCTALAVGLTGGYPMGAAYIADLRRDEVITTEEAEQLLAFCNNSGSAFLIGAVGCGVFHSVRIGFLLWGVHAFAAVVTGILLRKRAVFIPHSEFRIPNSANDESFAKLLTASIRQSVPAILNVCGFVICFTVVLSLLDAYGALSVAAGFIAQHTGAELSLVRSLLCGFVELGSGVGEMRTLLPTPAVLSMAAFVLGWGGVSVHFQTFALFSGTDIQGRLHLTGHLLSAGIAAVTMYVLANVV